MPDVYDKRVIVEGGDSSGTNTALAVILVVVLVGLVVWFVMSQNNNRAQDYTAPTSDDLNVNVEFPDMTGDGTTSGSTSGSSTTSGTSGSTSGSGSVTQ